ncbi:hypothetical protein ACFL0P_07000 [Candidatus Omnitrophota bacterium]
MSNKKIVIILMVFVLFFSVNAFAFQFEDFEWGISREDAETIIQDKGKILLFSDDEDEIGYTDTILDKPCQVILFFTPNSKQLAGITIIWKTTAVGKTLKYLLTKKYGQPQQVNEGANFYNWGSVENYRMLVLEFNSPQTDLIYYGGNYYKNLEKEKKEEDREKIEEEIDRF